MNDHKKTLNKDDVSNLSEDAPNIVLIGRVEDLTGFDTPGTEDDGAVYAYRFRDHSRGAAD